MGREKKRSTVKGQLQKTRAERGLVTTVVVTSLSNVISTSDVMPLILNAFRAAEIEDKTMTMHQMPIGHRVATRRGTFAFVQNTSSSVPIMRTTINSADANIVVLDREIRADREEVLRQTKQENVLFVVYTKEVSQEVKKYVKRVHGKHKIYTLSELRRVLETRMVLNRKRHARPMFIADTIEDVSANVFRITGAVDKGFTSYNVLINGAVQAKITEIHADGKKIDISTLRTMTKEEIVRTKEQSARMKEEEQENEIAEMVKDIQVATKDSNNSKDSIQYSINKYSNETEYSSDNAELGYIHTESSDDSDSDSDSDDNDCSDGYGSNGSDDGYYSDDDDRYGSEDSDGSDSSSNSNDNTKQTEGMEEYAEYRGFRSLNIGSRSALTKGTEELKAYRTQNLPQYYAELSFIGSERAQKKILAKKSPVPISTPLTVTLELQNWKDALQSIDAHSLLTVQGLYDYEGLQSIVTVGYSTNTPLSAQMSGRVVFDYGFCHTTPQSIIVGTGTELIKQKKESTAGTVCYIGPLILTDDKIQLVYESNLIGTGMQILRKDPIIVKTITFKGRPIKINKRSCIVGRMFRTRAQVQYFRHIKLYSSNRKEGRIKKPVGEHGRMKCYFCPPIKHNERVYLEIAKRVFIPW